MGNENTRKKVTLLTRERENFTRSATLTFKRLSAKTKIFFKFFGNVFEALTIFPQFFSLSEKDSSTYRLSPSGKLQSNFVSVIRYPIFPDGMLTWNPMGKKQVRENLCQRGRYNCLNNFRRMFLNNLPSEERKYDQHRSVKHQNRLSRKLSIASGVECTTTQFLKK